MPTQKLLQQAEPGSGLSPAIRIREALESLASQREHLRQIECCLRVQILENLDSVFRSLPSEDRERLETVVELTLRAPVKRQAGRIRGVIRMIEQNEKLINKE